MGKTTTRLRRSKAKLKGGEISVPCLPTKEAITKEGEPCLLTKTIVNTNYANWRHCGKRPLMPIGVICSDPASLCKETRAKLLLLV